MEAHRQIAALTLAQLNSRIAGALAVAPDLNEVWITAETSDVRSSGGHCYMELVQKDAAGRPVAKARAVIWASAFMRLGKIFADTTGSRLASDMKVMVRVNVNFHAVYGMSLVITDINPDYTAGDLVRRRNEIIARLKAEGVYELNRTLRWPVPAQRIAVVSARGAAGYGDFMRHLYGSGSRLRFVCELFEAVMQGERAPASVIAALERIASRCDEFDCVVLIRGGGAVSDLACFDDYALANNIAQFPLPVIVGIGHERDITVLDYVANSRVKTPTAAAELLLGRQSAEYERLISLARAVHTAVTAKLGGQHRQLDYCRGCLPAMARAVLGRHKAFLEQNSARALRRILALHIERPMRQLDSFTALLDPLAHTVLERDRAALNRFSPQTLRELLKVQCDRRRNRLDACGELLDALAPEATLRRGYSITRLNGRALTDAAALTPGNTVTTILASGSLESKVILVDTRNNNQSQNA